MFCFNDGPMVSISERAKCINRYLEIFLYGYIIVALVRFIFGDFNNFLNDLTTILSAFLSIIQSNYFWTSILIIFLLLNVFYEITNLMLIIQNWLLGFFTFDSSSGCIYLIVVISSLIINCFLSYYSFLAYRELKALFYEQHTISTTDQYSKLYLILVSLTDSELEMSEHTNILKY